MEEPRNYMFNRRESLKVMREMFWIIIMHISYEEVYDTIFHRNVKIMKDGAEYEALWCGALIGDEDGVMLRLYINKLYRGTYFCNLSEFRELYRYNLRPP